MNVDRDATGSNAKFVAHDAAAEVERTIALTAGPRVVARCVGIESRYIAGLTPAEAELVARAVPARRAEFASGRFALRSAIGANPEILRHSSGAPRSPDHLVCSLAHDPAVAVAVVAPRTLYCAIGIDIEPLQPLGADEASLIVGPADQVDDAMTAFVVKESVYKAWSTLGGGMLEHHDIVVRVVDGRFRALVAGGLTFDGVVRQTIDRVVALTCVPASAGPRCRRTITNVVAGIGPDDNFCTVVSNFDG